jgi:dTDP-4-dehydrorhamnose 3,5-epimerase-like enzyme
MGINKCRIITLPKISDTRGNLSVIESGNHIPFEIQRVYYLYDVPGGSHRGGHAHKKLEQLIIAMSGSFDILLNDGTNEIRYHLNRSYIGLYIPQMVWREMDNFSSGAVCMAVASDKYSESDYYRNFDEFMKAKEH